jgi:glyoxylate reductase
MVVDVRTVSSTTRSEQRVPEVLITRHIDADEVTTALEARHRVAYGPSGARMPRDELLRRVESVSGLIAMHTDVIDEELLARAPGLRIVATLSVGYDHIDVAAATRRRIWVSNTPGVVTEPTADMALLLLLATLRRAGEGFEEVRHGAWSEVDPEALWGSDARGMTLGILGFGRIGRALAARVAPLGMDVIYHDPARAPAEVEVSLGARWVGLHELLRSCDVLSVHLPLDPGTRGLIGRRELALMKPGSFLLNTARGPVIDEAALIDALHAGHLAGIGLDVFMNEPNVPRELREHPRAFCLPHIGTATRGTRLAMMSTCVANVAAVLDGRPPITPVNAIPAGSLERDDPIT